MNKKLTAFIVLGVLALSAPAFAGTGKFHRHHRAHKAKKAAATTPATPATPAAK